MVVPHSFMSAGKQGLRNWQIVLEGIKISKFVLSVDPLHYLDSTISFCGLLLGLNMVFHLTPDEVLVPSLRLLGESLESLCGTLMFS